MADGAAQAALFTEELLVADPISEARRKLFVQKLKGVSVAPHVLTEKNLKFLAITPLNAPRPPSRRSAPVLCLTGEDDWFIHGEAPHQVA
jgi:hypothetical protein